MNAEQRANELIEKYTEIQGELYHQIERVEHSTNLVKQHKMSFVEKLFNKSKLEQTITELNEYKSYLSAHAYYIDVKLSVLTKEIKKPNACVESLELINKSLYEGVTSVQMPQKLAEVLERFGINFGEKDKVNLAVEPLDKFSENDYCM